MSSELKRKCVHISMVVFALCIGRLSPLLICLATLTAFVFNLLILPIITGRGLERDDDLKRGFSLGLLMYPAILFVLSILFYDQQVYVALAWGAMAFGDGFAGLIGASLSGPKLPWNQNKSLSGSLAFLLLGTPATLGLLALLPAESLLGYGLIYWAPRVILAMAVAAFLETVPGLVDDNLVVPSGAAIVAYVAMQVQAIPNLPSNWLSGMIVVSLFILLSIASRKIDVPGGLLGGLLAWLIFLGGGFGSLALLLAFFVLGSGVSHYGYKEKLNQGTAQENKGKRQARHAMSNGGVAGLCGLMAWLSPADPWWLVMLAAAMASATADTVSSELGTLYGRNFIDILSLKPGRRGDDGVISLQGTLLGTLGGCVIAGIYLAVSGNLRGTLIVAAAGLFGNLADSVLGASLQRRGYMSNDTVNFANTLLAALFAGVLSGWHPLV